MKRWLTLITSSLVTTSGDKFGVMSAGTSGSSRAFATSAVAAAVAAIAFALSRLKGFQKDCNNFHDTKTWVMNTYSSRSKSLFVAATSSSSSLLSSLTAPSRCRTAASSSEVEAVRNVKWHSEAVLKLLRCHSSSYHLKTKILGIKILFSHEPQNFTAKA